MSRTPRPPLSGVSRRSRDRRTRRGQEDRGTALVEFAIVLPVLVVLLVGIVEAGRVLAAQVALQGAARDGARVLALGGSSAEVEQAARATAGPAEVVGITQSGCDSSGGGDAVVTVTARHRWRIPFVAIGDREWSATAQMRCEV